MQSRNSWSFLLITKNLKLVSHAEVKKMLYGILQLLCWAEGDFTTLLGRNEKVFEVLLEGWPWPFLPLTFSRLQENVWHSYKLTAPTLWLVPDCPVEKVFVVCYIYAVSLFTIENAIKNSFMCLFLGSNQSQIITVPSLKFFKLNIANWILIT